MCYYLDILWPDARLTSILAEERLVYNEMNFKYKSILFFFLLEMNIYSIKKNQKHTHI